MLLEDLQVQKLLTGFHIRTRKSDVLNVFVIVGQRNNHLCIFNDLKGQACSAQLSGLHCAACKLPVEADGALSKLSLDGLVTSNPEAVSSQDSAILFCLVTCQPFLCDIGVMGVAFNQNSSLVIQKQVSPVFTDCLGHSHLLPFFHHGLLSIGDSVAVELWIISAPPVFPELDVSVVVLNYLAHRISQFTEYCKC